MGTPHLAADLLHQGAAARRRPYEVDLALRAAVGGLQGSSYGPLAPLQGSEPGAPVLKVVSNGIIMGLEEFELGAHARRP